MAKRRLGRGIDALLQAHDTEQLTPETTRELVLVPLDHIEANPEQPRKSFDAESIHELADSIRSKGVLQPILVEELAQGRYRIVAGERRYRASLEAGLSEVPVLVRSFTVLERLEIALIENIQRRDLNPLEEAEAIRTLIESAGINQEEAARRLGMKRSSVANAVRLLRLPEQVRHALVVEEITAGHARALLSIKDDTQLVQAGELVVEHGLSVRVTEALAARVLSGDSPEAALAAVAGPQDASGGSDKAGPSASKKAGQSGKTAGGGFRARDAELADIEQRLIELFGTRVKLKGSLEKGTIEVSYLSMDDLDRIVQIVLPDEAT